MGKLDRLDLKLISALQRDSTRSVASIGEDIGLSQNACWRRIQKMQADGLLKSRVALFDAEKLGYKLVVFVVIRIVDFEKAWHAKFIEKATAIPEFVEFYRISGNLDYVAKALVRDMNHFDDVYEELCAGGASRLGSSIYFSTNSILNCN